MYSLISVSNSNLQPRFNICPTTDVDVVVRGDNARALVPMRWGIIPNWWSKPLREMRLATFNARAESIAEKPMFRESFRQRRCLMPVSGYYEWHYPDGPKKPPQPYYFTRGDGEVMTIAAIQDVWNDPQSGERLPDTRKGRRKTGEALQLSGSLYQIRNLSGGRGAKRGARGQERGHGG